MQGGCFKHMSPAALNCFNCFCRTCHRGGSFAILRHSDADHRRNHL